jgi:hypothetical protein
LQNLRREFKLAGQTADTSAGCLPTRWPRISQAKNQPDAPYQGQTVLQVTEIKSEKRRLVRDRRPFAIVLAGVLAVAGFAAASPGYLPCVGPASLRFSPVPPPVTNQIVPATPEVVPVPTVASPVPFGPMPELLPAPPPPEPPAITNQVSSGIPETTRPEEVVSPQMLLKYFNKSTNGTSSSVFTPLDFTPPKSPEPPPSKATYSTGP